MRFLRSLFAPRQQYRSFALLDHKGCCQAFKHCCLPPMGDGWVEIEEIRLNWLQRPLPADARISPRMPRSRAHYALTT
ncbi:hypothetical protein [Pseudomonas fluorescens]|uniref:Uncharacterized protein n=1 Tax=Pseudomonas fluorescens TaxID=294 RepID=A0A5E7A1Z2_PSEFL|nr:hypothetical protein [Pseudomonas fluorescens]VVN72880.1 hypothetical protein PS723_00527 [Pseudomonas fluorescens]